jgi:hypothetical protein
MKLVGLCLGFALSAAMVGACAKKVANCVPGETKQCFCPGTDKPGAQTCLADGSALEACNCGTAGSGSPTSSGAGMGGASSSSATQMTTMASMTGGFPGSSGTMMAGPSSATTGGGAADTMCMEMDCAACRKSKCTADLCKTQQQKCESNPKCKAILDCEAACAGDQQCIGKCVSMASDMAAIMDYFGIYKCHLCPPPKGQAPCYSECGGAMACPSLP